LRHTYASIALAKGVNPAIVSRRLGHSTVAFTLDVYSHVLPQVDAEAAEPIASFDAARTSQSDVLSRSGAGWVCRSPLPDSAPRDGG
jgi:hypothetical protein